MRTKRLALRGSKARKSRTTERNNGSAEILLLKGRRRGQRDKCKLHHLAADWYNRVSHDDYRLILNWVNTRPEITWNDGMDPTQRQAIVPAAPLGGGVSRPPGNNNTITEIP